MKTSAQELFLQANQCYAKKEYKDAEQFYKKIPHKSAAVWYNMGNCAYKNGNEIEALLYWKRAKIRGDSNIGQNSEYNSTIVTKKLNIPKQTHLSMPNLPALPLQILFFCTFSVFLFINRKLWRTRRFALLASISMIVMGTGVITYATYKKTISNYALAMHDESTMFAGPDCQFHEIMQIPKGSEVVVLEKKNGWVKISWSGSHGWIQEKMIEVI